MGMYTLITTNYILKELCKAICVLGLEAFCLKVNYFFAHKQNVEGLLNSLPLQQCKDIFPSFPTVLFSHWEKSETPNIMGISGLTSLRVQG